MEEVLNLKNYRQITLIFEYGNQKISIIAQPYRTLGDVKNKALLRIFDCPPNLHCYYLNRDYSHKENEQIGNLFPRREIVTIRLTLPLKNIFQDSKIKLNSETFPIIDNYSKKPYFHVPSRSKIEMIPVKDVKNIYKQQVNNTNFLDEDEIISKNKNKIF